MAFASDHLQRTYAAWASALRQDRQFDRAVGVYRDLLPEVVRARVPRRFGPTWPRRTSSDQRRRARG